MPLVPALAGPVGFNLGLPGPRRTVGLDVVDVCDIVDVCDNVDVCDVGGLSKRLYEDEPCPLSMLPVSITKS